MLNTQGMGRARSLTGLVAGAVWAVAGWAGAASVAAQVGGAEPPPLRAFATAPVPPPTGPVATASIRFSEAMVDAAGANPGALDFLSIEPAIPVRLVWSSVDVLDVTAASGWFPYDTPIGIRVGTSARARSGARLAEPLLVTFTTPKPRIALDGKRRASDGRVVLVVRADQPLRPADARALMASVRYHPFVSPRRPLDAGALAPGAGIDAATIAAHDAAARAAQARAAWTRRVPVQRAPATDAPDLEPGPHDLVLVTRERPPDGTRLAIGPPVPPDLETRPAAYRSADPRDDPRRRVVTVDDALWLTASCIAACAPEMVAIATSRPVDLQAIQRALRVIDVTGASPQPVSPRLIAPDTASGPVSLEALGYTLSTGRRYAFTLDDGSLTSADGVRLDGAWVGVVRTSLRESFATLGNHRDAVWEAGQGPALPVVTRSLEDVLVGASPVTMADVSAMLAGHDRGRRWTTAPMPALRRVPIAGNDDTTRVTLVDASAGLSPRGTGLVWLALQPGRDLPGVTDMVTVHAGPGWSRGALVQVTHLGLTVRTYGDAVLTWVTRLDTGMPVPGAAVRIVDAEQRTLWTGVTDDDGLARTDRGAVAAARGAPRLVIVEHDGDQAFAEPLAGWSLEPRLGERPEARALVGTVLTDRGVYRPGDTVMVKAIVRDRVDGKLTPLAPGSTLTLTLDRDGERAATHEARVGAGGGAEWAVPIAADARLDAGYVVRVHRGEPTPPTPWWYGDEPLSARFAVKALRPLEIAATARARAQAGPDGRSTLALSVDAHDLTGIALTGAQVTWRLHRLENWSDLPRPDAFWRFSVGTRGDDWREVATGTGVADGEAGYSTIVERPAGREAAGRFRFSVEITDPASGQAMAADTDEVLVAPRAILGLASAEARGGRSGVDLIALDADGRLVPGVDVAVTLRPRQGGAALPVTVRAVTASAPVRVTFPAAPGATAVAEGLGSVEVLASAADPAAAVVPTSTWTHATWRLTSAPPAEPSAPSTPSGDRTWLSLDQASYRLGDVARLTVRTPWPEASALVTVERDGLGAVHAFRGGAEPRVLDIPIDESAIGGLRVAATFVRGRSAPCCVGSSDPGAPSVLADHVDVAVDPASARLRVAIDTGRDPARPGARLRVHVRVSDHEARPAPAEVTLWAVDEGWLRQTAYTLPAIDDAMLTRDVPAFQTWDSRRALLRRGLPDPWRGDLVQTDSASRDGQVAATDLDGAVRTDMRPLAFWVGAAKADAAGRVDADVTLPDTLTTYRVMAIAADAHRFGQAAQPLVVSSPVMLRPALPRQLSQGDRATIRITAASRVETPVRGRLIVESLTPDLLAIDDAPPALALAPGQRQTIAVRVRALAAGEARLRVRLVSPDASDAVEHRLPIVAHTEIEHYTVTGVLTGTTTEAIAVPADVSGDAGGLSVALSASALGGVSLAGRDLDDYAYLCLEQRSSRLVALGLAVAEGGPFAFAPINARDAREALDRGLAQLRTYRCRDREGYGLWDGGCRVGSPYLATYVLFVLQRLDDLGIAVDEAEMTHAVDAVVAALDASPVDASGMAALGDWRALAVKVLADADQFPAAEADRLLARRATLPPWALAHLYDALAEARPDAPVVAELRGRLIRAIEPDGGAAYVSAARDRFDWSWPSHTKSTAIVLDVLARRGAIDAANAGRLAQWLLKARRAGVWSSTQENAWALLALASYRREVEQRAGTSAAAMVHLGDTCLLDATLATGGDAATRDVPMRDVVAGLGAARAGRLALTASGTQPVHYTARLVMHRPLASLTPVDRGFVVERRYTRRDDAREQPVSSVVAGDVVRVTLTVRTSESRFLVALSDPLPGGFEAIDPELASTGHRERDAAFLYTTVFDHVQRRDGRVDLFATQIPAGTHTFSYLVRATTPGTFYSAPPRAEAMYEPEVFGRGAGVTVTVTPTP